MRVAIGFGGPASRRARDFEEQVGFACEAERLGVDSAWSAEAWGMDAVSPLAYLAARTRRLRLGTGVMQISARTPSMTALTLAAISGDRFLLGLGASGPQVVEGLQGVSFTKPITRLRETLEIVRMAFRGETLEYAGRLHRLPLPGGLADLDLCVGAAVAFAADPEPWIRRRKSALAFTLGAMGSATANFYNDAYRRGGFEDAATEVQALWPAGRRDEAAARVPDAMVLQSSMLGSEPAVRERIRRYRDAGITTLRLEPLGDDPASRLETLGRAIELIRQECGPGFGPAGPRP